MPHWAFRSSRLSAEPAGVRCFAQYRSPVDRGLACGQFLTRHLESTMLSVSLYCEIPVVSLGEPVNSKTPTTTRGVFRASRARNRCVWTKSRVPATDPGRRLHGSFSATWPRSLLVEVPPANRPAPDYPLVVANRLLTLASRGCQWDRGRETFLS